MKFRKPQDCQTQCMCPDLASMLDPRQGLCRLAERIDWQEFQREFEPLYSQEGRSAKPVRLMVSLLLLKQMEVLNDLVYFRKRIGKAAAKAEVIADTTVQGKEHHFPDRQ